MKVNGRMTNDMDRESICLKTEIDLAENGRKIKERGKEILYGAMETFTGALGKMIIEKDRV